MFSTLRAAVGGPRHARSVPAARVATRAPASRFDSDPPSNRTARTIARFAAAAEASVFTATAATPAGVLVGRSGLGAHGHGTSR
jgi:uncharacterized protein (DUF2336 family)